MFFSMWTTLCRLLRLETRSRCCPSLKIDWTSWCPGKISQPDVTMLQCCNKIMLQCCYAIVIWCYNAIILVCYDINLLQHYNVMMLYYNNNTHNVCNSTRVPEIPGVTMGLKRLHKISISLVKLVHMIIVTILKLSFQ